MTIRGARHAARSRGVLDFRDLELGDVRDAIRRSENRRAAVRAWLGGIEVPEGLSPERLARLVDDLSVDAVTRLVDAYHAHIGDVTGEVNLHMASLLENPGEERAAHLRAIDEALKQPLTFPGFLDVELRRPDSPLAARVRRELGGEEVDLRLEAGEGRPAEAPEVASARRPAGARPRPGTPEFDEWGLRRARELLLRTEDRGWQTRSARQLLDSWERVHGSRDVEAVVSHLFARSHSRRDPRTRAAVLAVLRVSGAYRVRRVRRNEGRFRRAILKRIKETPNHPLRIFLRRRRVVRKRRGEEVEVEIVDLESRVGGEEDPDLMAVDAGHIVSFHSGEPERFFIQDPRDNRDLEAPGELRGVIFDRSTSVIEIDGVPIERSYAEQIESFLRDRGRTDVWPPGTVAAASESPGWIPPD